MVAPADVLQRKKRPRRTTRPGTRTVVNPPPALSPATTRRPSPNSPQRAGAAHEGGDGCAGVMRPLSRSSSRTGSNDAKLDALAATRPAEARTPIGQLTCTGLN